MDDMEEILAARFDFTLNENKYIQNIEVDDKGEVIYSPEGIQGRVVSSTPIAFIEPEPKPVKEEPDVDVNDLAGLLDESVKSEPKEDKAAALRDQKNKYYFQFRLDELDPPDNPAPKICIGVCRDDFLVNQDLSRQKNVWCLNLASGDKYTR